MKKDIIFNLNHLNRFKIIDKPCTTVLQSNSKLDYDNIYSPEDNPRWLVNLKAMTSQNIEMIEELLNRDKVLTYKDVGHLFMTGALWEEQVDEPIDLPTKGENIIATFDYVEGELLCTRLTLIPKYKAKEYLPVKYLIAKIEEFETIIKEMNE